MNTTAAELRSRLETALEHRIPRALTPPQRSLPERMPTGIASVDALTGGVPLGCLTEICGPTSSGRTSVLHSLLAECMRRDEICALVDASDAFDPQSAANVGVDLARLLWVRCGKKSGDRVIGSSCEGKSSLHREKSFAHPVFKSPDHPITRSPDSSLEQALKTTDLLLQAGGFGLVVLDLADISIASTRRIPLTTWFRFRRAVENTSTALLIVEQQPHAKSCAALVMDLAAQQASWSEAPDQNETIGDTHFGNNVSPSFCVTGQGVAIPFEKLLASSFEMPQRWNTPRARLLNTVHVYLQVARSRGIEGRGKFPARSEVVIPSPRQRSRGIAVPIQAVSVQ
jgi:recombination protein RecA